MKPETETVWFARGGGVARTGPFKTQAEASAALILAKRTYPDVPEFPDDIFVWPESVSKRKAECKK